MRKINLIFFILISTACTPYYLFHKKYNRIDKLAQPASIENVFGNYSYNIGVGGGERITLLSENQFEYSFRNCFGYGIGEGVYELNANQLTLNYKTGKVYKLEFVGDKILRDSSNVENRPASIYLWSEKGLHEIVDSLRYFNSPKFWKEE
jgi:hypothetical protein